ncbi:MAG: hypothetical protein ACP5LP_00460 [Candidatus Micrarchaeia archaeon]
MFNIMLAALHFIILSFGAIYSLIPIILILLLIIAAAGLGRGLGIFDLLGVGTLLGLTKGAAKGGTGRGLTRRYGLYGDSSNYSRFKSTTAYVGPWYKSVSKTASSTQAAKKNLETVGKQVVPDSNKGKGFFLTPSGRRIGDINLAVLAADPRIKKLQSGIDRLKQKQTKSQNFFLSHLYFGGDSKNAQFTLKGLQASRKGVGAKNIYDIRNAKIAKLEESLEKRKNLLLGKQALKASLLKNGRLDMKSRMILGLSGIIPAYFFVRDFKPNNDISNLAGMNDSVFKQRLSTLGADKIIKKASQQNLQDLINASHTNPTAKANLDLLIGSATLVGFSKLASIMPSKDLAEFIDKSNINAYSTSLKRYWLDKNKDNPQIKKIISQLNLNTNNIKNFNDAQINEVFDRFSKSPMIVTGSNAVAMKEANSIQAKTNKMQLLYMHSRNELSKRALKSGYVTPQQADEARSILEQHGIINKDYIMVGAAVAASGQGAFINKKRITESYLRQLGKDNFSNVSANNHAIRPPTDSAALPFDTNVTRDTSDWQTFFKQYSGAGAWKPKITISSKSVIDSSPSTWERPNPFLDPYWHNSGSTQPVIIKPPATNPTKNNNSGDTAGIGKDEEREAYEKKREEVRNAHLKSRLDIQNKLSKQQYEMETGLTNSAPQQNAIIDHTSALYNQPEHKPKRQDIQPPPQTGHESTETQNPSKAPKTQQPSKRKKK